MKPLTPQEVELREITARITAEMKAEERRLAAEERRKRTTTSNEGRT